MWKKNIVLMPVIFALAASPLCAATVSFLVIEANPPREITASQHSIMWENSLMDVFFESGHIVTNSPILRLGHVPDDGFPAEAERDLELAKEGGMEYFLLAIIRHPAPHNVSLRLFRTDSREMLLEHQYTDMTYRTSKEENDAIKNSVAVMAARLR